MQQPVAWGRMVLVALALAVACGGTQQVPPSAGEGRNMQNDEAVETGIAQLDAVLHARALAPGESLAVRLLGLVGPDGSWSLAEIAVERIDGGVRLTPFVHHRLGVNAIQMLIPLDEKVLVPLEEGVQRLEVRGRDSTHTASIRVAAGGQRRPPDTHLALQLVTSGLRSHEFVLFRAYPGDGYVEAIEMRETGADGTGPWQVLPGCEREGAELHGRLLVDPARGVRSIEARARSGQGDLDPEPSFLKLSTER